MPAPAPFATLLYAPNDGKSRVLSDFAARRRGEGVDIDGLVIETVWHDPRTKGGLEAHALASGRRIPLTRPFADGIPVGRWQLLPEAVAETEAVLAAAVDRPAALLVVDKFGPLEGRGGGLAGPLGAALDRDIAMVVAVRREFARAWDAFVAAHAPDRSAVEARCDTDPEALEAWWQHARAAIRAPG